MEGPEIDEESVSPWQKLLRQRVIQTLALYIPIGWVLNEIVSAATEKFVLPDWIASTAMILFIAGIPVTAFLAWAFQWDKSGLTTDVKGWRGGITLTIAVTLLFTVSAFLYLNLREEALLENTGALTEPVAVIAVLPFEEQPDEGNLLGNRFALEITDRLSKHPDLYVVSSGASFAPQLASLAPMKQQQQLNADHILTGAISKDDQGYRLKVRLVDTAQQVLWQDDMRFGADADSQAGLQRRISMHTAEVLGTKYKSSEYCEPSNSIDALEAYHSARLKLNQRGRENLAEAEFLLKKAIRLDPDYGHAYSALSLAYLLQTRWKPEYRNGKIASEVARKALDRCATLGIAYKIWVPAYEGVTNEHINQELQWRDALAMEPNDIWLLDNYSLNLVPLGMGEAQDKLLKRANRINPLDPRVLVGKAWAEWSKGNFARSLELVDQIEREGERSCNVPNLRIFLGFKTSEAATIKAWESFKLTDCTGGGLRLLFEDLGPETVYQSFHQREARREFLDYMRRQVDKNPNMVMLQAISRSDVDLAFQAIESGFSSDQYLHKDGWWTDDEPTALFRRDPRFADLIERLGFVEYWKEFGWPDGKCSPLGTSFVCDN